MFSYRTLLKQAWMTAWKHKYLWFLGLFASLVAGSGSWEYQVVTQNLGQNPVSGSYAQFEKFLALGDVLQNFFFGLGHLFQQDLWTILNIFSVLLVTATLLIFFVWLAVTSQAALVGDVKKILTAKKTPANLTIRESLSAGHKHFWPVLGLNILIKVLVYCAFFIIGLPLLFMTVSDSTILFVLYILIFIIFIPVALSLSLIIKYSISYNVLENRTFVASLENGFKLFRKNWLISLEMAVILFLTNFLLSGLVLVTFAIFLLPLLFLGILFNLYWLIIALLLLAIALVVIFGSFLTTFQISAWTDLFLHLKEKGALAKLERLFNRNSADSEK